MIWQNFVFADYLVFQRVRDKWYRCNYKVPKKKKEEMTNRYIYKLLY